MANTSSTDIIKVFFNYLQKFTSLSEEEFEHLILPVCKVRKFGKKEFLTKAGDVENYFNFIVKGLARKFYKKNAHEFNTQISFEGQMLLSQESFYSRKPSDYFIQAIEPTTVVSIAHMELEKVFASSHKLEHIGRLMATFSMVIKDNWQIQLVKMTPRERFLNFVTKNPELMQRVPQKFLASYLNIKPETFSRFKHLLRGHIKKSENKL